MWAVYLAIAFVVISAHGLLYLLFKVGVEESKKPVPPHIKRRQPREYRERIEQLERFQHDTSNIGVLL